MTKGWLLVLCSSGPEEAEVSPGLMGHVVPPLLGPVGCEPGPDMMS